jgi:hypothetical protein
VELLAYMKSEFHGKEKPIEFSVFLIKGIKLFYVTALLKKIKRLFIWTFMKENGEIL